MANKPLDLKIKRTGNHGGGVRGDTMPRHSPLFEGRFGRVFRALPDAIFDFDGLVEATKPGLMTAEPEVDDANPTWPIAAAEDPNTSFHDDEENTGIPAGFTYVGQFIDHDLTFDPASSLQQQNDPDALVDFRTPRFDLDSVYGRGPGDQPYMYAPDGKHFLLGRPLTEGDPKKGGRTTNVRDLPRYDNSDSGQTAAGRRALIGDKRNDENVIVSQLHASILQFHNRLIDDNPALSFEAAQRMTRWHYQYAMLNDFLPRMVGWDMVKKILPHLHKKDGKISEEKPQLNFFKFRESAFMPIEFAAAAYRFGHSMVRPIYRLNTFNDFADDDVSPTESSRGLRGRFFIFAGVPGRGLNGFGQHFNSDMAIDWSLFFDINGSGQKVGKARVQPSYKLDTSLVNPLAFLPEFSKSDARPPLTVAALQSQIADPAVPANLAFRNLLRGNSMGLPSGEDVARAMSERVLDPSEIRIGKATVDDMVDGANPTLSSLHDTFVGRTPLWIYTLAEAQAQWWSEVKQAKLKGDDAAKHPVRLGPVGGRIVAETLIGLLLADSHSFISQDPHWTPRKDMTSAKHFGFGDMIKYALKL